jgi:type III secretion protein T
MSEAALYEHIQTFLLAIACTQPRIIAMFLAIPLFSTSVMPGLLRYAMCAAIGAHMAPALIPLELPQGFFGAQVVLIIVKEIFIGFVMGYLVAIPFWAFESLGFLIDNQRGASVAATLNPMTGNDSSPLGQLFNQAFIVFFFISGGFMLLLGMLYESFMLWPLLTWFPSMHDDTAKLLLDQLSKMARVAILLASPAMVAMLLAEVGLALVSRFVPQLQVFFLAMPIKCAIAFLVLGLYVSTLFTYGAAYEREFSGIVPYLDQQWRTAPGVASEPTR